MIPLHRCNSCGFLSTRADAYRNIQRVLFCKSCANGYDDGRDPVAEWVREKLPRPHPQEDKP